MREGSRLSHFLICAEDITAQPYTNKEVMEKVKNCIDKLRTQCEAVGRCVAMDSEGVHVKARRLLTTEMKSIVFLSCQAH